MSCARIAPRTTRGGHRGFMLIGLLVLLALGGWSLATYTEGAAAARQRDAELDLLWIGQQYSRAIESYYRATPGPIKQLPMRFEELLQDPRYPQPVRHLRRLYRDPLAPDEPWGIVRLNGQIVGVYSQAAGEPFRRAGFDAGLESFTGAASYADWRFIWVPPRQATNHPNTPAPGPRAPGTTNPPSLRQARP
jgi:type II secretory pathway pseudopilin PulG